MAKQSKRLSRSQWQKHLDDQVKSGLSQAAYCREHQINQKYFSLWKGQLRKAEASTHASNVDAIDFIPIKVKSGEQTNTISAAAITPSLDKLKHPALCIEVKLTLSNGIGIELHLPNEFVLLPLISQLTQLSC